MTYDTPRKNYTGFAFVAMLHLVAAGIAITHSKITITHADRGPVTVDPIPEKKQERPEPEPQRDIDMRPAPPIPVLDPLPLPPPVTTNNPPPVIDGGPTTTTTGGGEDCIGGCTGRGTKGDATRPAPVTVAPVIDAGACAKPDYPKTSLRNGDTGTVTLAFLIGKDGRVASAKVENSSGFRELDRAAVAGLSLCRFKPGTVDGVPFESWTRMQYAWRLDD